MYVFKLTAAEHYEYAISILSLSVISVPCLPNNQAIWIVDRINVS